MVSRVVEMVITKPPKGPLGMVVCRAAPASTPLFQGPCILTGDKAPYEVSGLMYLLSDVLSECYILNCAFGSVFQFLLHSVIWNISWVSHGPTPPLLH